MGKNFPLPKSERIFLRKEIETLFSKGESFFSGSFKVKYCAGPDLTEPAKVLVSVPKRLMKRSVDRNRIKRLTKECFRLNKKRLNDFLEVRHYGLLVAFIYTKTKIPEFPEVERDIVNSFSKIINKLDV